MAGGGRRAGAGRPPGSGWRPKVSELREEAIDKMRAIVGSETDPLTYVCELAADPEADVQLRLSAASIALPYLYPKLSQTQVASTHTIVRVDPAQTLAKFMERIEQLRSASAPIEGAPVKVLAEASA